MADNEKLGSTSPQILLKNATNLDKLVNGRESESLPDRFAVLRRTWYGMEMAFNRFITYITGRGEQAVGAIGWQELGNWATGLTVDNRQQIVYYNGSWYKYLGELEHVITGDSPENDGGVWSAENPTGKWSNIGDAALRSNLGSSELPGASLVALDNGNVADAILYKTPEMFGAKGDGTTDDTAAIQSAANWLCAASNRHLIFSSGRIYRQSSPVDFTFSNGVKCCAIEMHGAIKPDGGVGDAFLINDAVGCDFKLNVLGDGVSISVDGTTAVTLPDGFPDYSSPDPSGSQQAFVFNSCRSVRIDAVGYGYAGRVLRTKSTRSLKTSFLDISIRTGDSATVIGSGQCGQAMYLEGGSDAFGIINIAQTNWDVYGSVVYKLADLSIAYWENGSGYANASMTFIGCQTVHAGIIASGGVNQKYPSVVISDTSDRPTIGFSIQRLFCVTGNNNLVLEGLGSDDALRKSVTINSFYSIQAAADGAVINGMSNVEINNVHIDNVQTGIRIKGLVRNVRISGYIKNPVDYGFISDSDAEIHEFYFNGRILSASSTLDCINFTAGNILTATFRDCYIFATHGAFNLPSSNDVKIIGGSHSAVTMFPGSRPAIIKDTSGFISAKRGRVSFPVGSLTGATLIVTHGLSLAPTSVTLTPLGAVSGANLSISASDGLTFTVTYTGPTLSTIFEFRWRADCELV
ncbi:hypothetical protein [Klebsiella michiganensis]|uniref:hypothetical protein n=1 Tax=Klebsiella michiganensis TaxID=1134687 RepID=UPI0022DCEEBA|nr:hypothetical protein [Klebsiella michiganensis]